MNGARQCRSSASLGPEGVKTFYARTCLARRRSQQHSRVHWRPLQRCPRHGEGRRPFAFTLRLTRSVKAKGPTRSASGEKLGDLRVERGGVGGE